MVRKFYISGIAVSGCIRYLGRSGNHVVDYMNDSVGSRKVSVNNFSIAYSNSICSRNVSIDFDFTFVLLDYKFENLQEDTTTSTLLPDNTLTGPVLSPRLYTVPETT